MNTSKSNRSTSSPTTRSILGGDLRTAVHAGPLLLEKRNGTAALERYLSRDDRRDLVLIHHGQSRLHEVADATGVQEVEVEETEREPEAERATRTALAMGAEAIEFTIARPALTTLSGTPIAEIPCSEAERYAAESGLRSEIQDKVRAGCEALRAGLRRVRIGNPTALLQGRATTIVPDTSIALAGAALPASPTEGEADTPNPDRDPGMHPIERRRPESPRSLPALKPRRTRKRRLRFSPRQGCEIGPRTRSPFPTDRFLPLGFDRSQARRLRRHA